jgi:hypothetical protein
MSRSENPAQIQIRILAMLSSLSVTSETQSPIWMANYRLLFSNP